MLFDINQRVHNVAKYAKANLVFIGLAGVILFPLYYYIFNYVFPQPYENLNLRIIGTAIFFPIIFHSFVEDSNIYKKYFPWYLLFCITYAITFFCSFMAIMNQFSVIWTLTNLGVLFLFIIIIYDWVIAILMMIIGFVLACVAVIVIGQSALFSSVNSEYLLVCFLILFCGAIFRYKNKAADIALLSLLKDLSASIAHETRGPLGSINQSISLINERMEKLKNNLPANFNLKDINEIKELIEMIERAIVRGNMTIDMILKNIQEKKIDSSDFKVILMSDVIKVTMREYAFGPGEKEKIFINYANDFYFKGNENLMVFTFFNLIKNSLYYMKIIANGRIDIWMESNNETNILHFRDNGPGIARERLPHMFENYKTQGKQGGTGLGLPFCKRALISFNGSIECLSELGEWTEFVMSFPKCNEAPSTEEDEEDISLGEIQKLIDNKTILLVDDDNLIRMVMKARLKEFNVTIIEAQQGKEAIDILDKRDVDLIFMDIQMPEIDGLETTKQIRSGIHFKNFQNYKDVPIIALSGNAEDDKILIQESGMSDYLTKSMTKEELFIAIRKWLKFSANKKYTK